MLVNLILKFVGKKVTRAATLTFQYEVFSIGDGCKLQSEIHQWLMDTVDRILQGNYHGAITAGDVSEQEVWFYLSFYKS